MKMGWQTIPMGQLCSIKNGKSDTKDAVADGEYALFDRSRVIKRSNRYLFDCEALIIPGEGMEFLPRHFVGKFDLHQRAYALQNFSNLIDVRFLFYYLHHRSDYLPNVAVGATVKSLRMRHFEQFPILITDVPEQQRIVAILDEAFQGIAIAAVNAEKNMSNAQEIFLSHLHETFSANCNDWTVTPLASLCEKQRLITYGVIKLGDEIPDGAPCLRTSNVRWLKIETEGMKRIAHDLSKEYSRTILKGGEVLVNVRGTLGGVAVATEDMVGWNVSREVAVVPIDPALANPKFISYLIGSGASQKWLGGVKKGAAYVGINLEDLRLFPVSIPNSNEQQSIVTQLDDLYAETQRLEAIYQQKIAALAELKKSILHRAFSGQLH